jgi:hypothetical protein
MTWKYRFRLGPRRFACCLGIGGLICWGDMINHHLLGDRVRRLCDYHDFRITGQRPGEDRS